MLGLIDHGLAGRHHLTTVYTDSRNLQYKVYFGLGQCLDLIHTPEVFKVSLAGIRLGHYLMRSLGPSTSNKSFLDIGTGSGVHALLMRRLGSHDITATDISGDSVEQAKLHERINFKHEKISFSVSDLFDQIPERKFHTIAFNPPGWRTPSPSLIQRLNTVELTEQMPIRAMFYGDDVVARFLDDLPRYMDPQGRAIVGLNSLVGINDVLNKYNQKYNNEPPLAYRLVERHTLPLLYYSAHWQRLSKHFKKEFESWLKQNLAAYSTDQNGEIYWSYEIIEFSHRAD